MHLEHPLLTRFPEVREVLLEQIAEDPLIAHLAADYSELCARLALLGNPKSREYQALWEELQTLQAGLLQHLQPPEAACAGHVQGKVAASAYWALPQ